MFYDAAKFPFVPELEKNWSIVREEVDRLTQEDFAKLSLLPGNTPDSWTAVMFYYGVGGRDVERIEENCALCPRTVELLDGIPVVGSAGISRLGAGKRIRPHADFRIPLRCHLGVIVPEGCGIRAGTTRHWEEGKCLIIDTTAVHEAWNDSDRDRYVLVFDVHPEAIGIRAEDYRERPTLRSRAVSAGQWVRYVGWRGLAPLGWRGRRGRKYPTR